MSSTVRTEAIIVALFNILALAICIFGAIQARHNANISRYFIPNYQVPTDRQLIPVKVYRDYREMIA